MLEFVLQEELASRLVPSLPQLLPVIAGAGGASSVSLLAQLVALLEQAQQAGSTLAARTEERLGELQHMTAECDVLRVQLASMGTRAQGVPQQNEQLRTELELVGFEQPSKC
eukprot:g3158.t1